MRGRSLKVRTELFNKTKENFAEVPKNFYRQAVYEAVHIIDQKIGLFKCIDTFDAPSCYSIFVNFLCY